MAVEKFKSKCQQCETEEEFEYVGTGNSKFKCLKCGKELKNE